MTSMHDRFNLMLTTLETRGADVDEAKLVTDATSLVTQRRDPYFKSLHARFVRLTPKVWAIEAAQRPFRENDRAGRQMVDAWSMLAAELRAKGLEVAPRETLGKALKHWDGETTDLLTVHGIADGEYLIALEGDRWHVKKNLGERWSESLANYERPLEAFFAL